MQSATGVAPPPIPQLQQQQLNMPLPPQQLTWNQAPQISQPQYTPPPTNPDEIRTLWIGDLQFWMDENYVLGCFAQTYKVVSVKLIRNKQTSQLEGYGFIEFISRDEAVKALQMFNGTLMPNAEQNFRLNWASTGEKRGDGSPEFSIFVGDLAPDVTDYVLQETFKQRYDSVKGVKVVIDQVTGRGKGYGFVKFGDESEQQRAMTEMNGQLCSSRPMRIGAAGNKSSMNGQQFPRVLYQTSQGNPSENDPNNTTIFVGGLDPNVSDDALKLIFGQFGEIVHVKIPVGKRCGFVQFTDRSCAEQALQTLNGTQLEGQNIRLSWGRAPANRQNSAGAAPADPSGWNNGHYGYGNGYEAYGYASPAPQNPNLYYGGGYPGYGHFQQPFHHQH